MSFGQETQDVFDALPPAMQLAFMKQDPAALEECLLAMDREHAEYFMQQCVSVGLWVRTDGDELDVQQIQKANSNANSEELGSGSSSAAELSELNPVNANQVELATVGAGAAEREFVAEQDWNCRCCGMSNFWWRRLCRKCRTRSVTHAQGKRARDSYSNSFARYHKKQAAPRHSHNRNRQQRHGVGQLHRVLVSMGLSKYTAAFIEEGWTDIAGWRSLDDDTLRADLHFKAGDIERFNRLKTRYIATMVACSPTPTPRSSAKNSPRLSHIAAADRECAVPERLARAEDLSVRFLRFSKDMASAHMDRLVYSISPLSFEGGLDRVHAKIYDFCFHCIPYHVIPSAVHNYFGDALCGHLTRPLDDDHFEDPRADRDDVSTAQFERRFVLDGGRAFILRVMTDYHVKSKRRAHSHGYGHGHSGGRGGKYKYWAKFALALYADRADRSAVEGSTEAAEAAEMSPKETKSTRMATVTARRSTSTRTTTSPAVTPTACTYTKRTGKTKQGKENKKEKGKKRSPGQRHYQCHLVFT